MRFSSASACQHLATAYTEFVQLLGTVSGHASFACGKMWESNLPVQKQGVPANTAPEAPKGMDLEWFEGGGSQGFYSTFTYRIFCC